MPVILAVERLGQEDYQKFEASLGYTVQGRLGYRVRPCLKKPKFLLLQLEKLSTLSSLFVDILQFVTIETF